MCEIKNSVGLCAKEQKFFSAAADALRFTAQRAPLTLAEQVYIIAFSTALNLGGSVSALIDALSSDEKNEQFATVYGMKADGVTEQSFAVGDIAACEFCDGDRVYVNIGDRIVDFSHGYAECSLKTVFESVEKSERHVFLRPSMAVCSFSESEEYVKEENLTPEQTALVKTAESYLARGYSCQYDDSRFTSVGGGEFRWQIGIKNPEDYTFARWGYLNCAAFCYDLYRTALGVDLGRLYTTFNMISHYVDGGFTPGEPMYPLFYELTNKESEEEIERLCSELRRTLRVGDLIVYRRHVGTGHVIAYVGDGMVIHSTGASYNYSGSFETFEPTIRYMSLEQTLFDKESVRYLFSEKVSRYGILRPLDKFDAEIPENTRNRVKNMQGVIAQKVCSASEAHTVNPGEEITYTFSIYNTNEASVTLEIEDLIPEGVEYLCGDGNFDGKKFTATVTVLPKSELNLSYNVRVIGELGSVISGDGATVGGVKHGTNVVHIEKTFRASDFERIKEAVEYFRKKGENGLSGFSLANAIFERAGVGTVFKEPELWAVEDCLFVKEEFFVIRKGSKYARAIAPRLYGGCNLQTQNVYSETCKDSTDRVRLPVREDLVIGDVLIFKCAAGVGIYLYTGEDKLVDLNSKELAFDKRDISKRLERLLSCHHYFVVIRPSMIEE